MNRDEKQALISNARELGVRCGGLLNIIKQNEPIPAGAAIADVLGDSIAGNPPAAMHGVEASDLDVQASVDALRS